MVVKITFDAKGALNTLDVVRGKLPNAIYTGLIKATALTREEVLDNIKNGANKNLGWPAFSQATILRKRKRGRSLSGMIDTGRMFGAIYEKVSRSKLEGEVYPGVKYHNYLEKGTKKMPARQTFGPVPARVSPRIKQIFEFEILAVTN